jgi:hypothetical protein
MSDAAIRTPAFALRPFLEKLEGASMRVRFHKDGAEIHDLSKRAASQFIHAETFNALAAAGYVDVGTGQMTEAGRKALAELRFGSIPGVSSGGGITPTGPGGPDPRKGGR